MFSNFSVEFNSGKARDMTAAEITIAAEQGIPQWPYGGNQQPNNPEGDSSDSSEEDSPPPDPEDDSSDSSEEEQPPVPPPQPEEDSSDSSEEEQPPVPPPQPEEDSSDSSEEEQPPVPPPQPEEDSSDSSEEEQPPVPPPQDPEDDSSDSSEEEQPPVLPQPEEDSSDSSEEKQPPVFSPQPEEDSSDSPEEEHSPPRPAPSLSDGHSASSKSPHKASDGNSYGDDYRDDDENPVSFIVYPNMNCAHGIDNFYKKIEETTHKVCSEKCLGNSLCSAYSYHGNTRSCKLRQHCSNLRTHHGVATYVKDRSPDDSDNTSEASLMMMTMPSYPHVSALYLINMADCV